MRSASTGTVCPDDVPPPSGVAPHRPRSSRAWRRSCAITSSSKPRRSIARGMAPAAARDAARRRFGSVALVKDDCRESWGMRAIDMLAQDVRFALRNLRKYPSYTAIVLLTLGARHRRQHRDLQRRPRRAAAAAALRQRRPAGRGPPAGAEDRRRQRRRLGEGDRRLPRADRRARRGRRVPPDVVQPARPRRGVARPDRRRLGQLLRRARRDADARPDLPRRRRREERAGGAGAQLRLLAAARSAAIPASSAAPSR